LGEVKVFLSIGRKGTFYDLKNPGTFAPPPPPPNLICWTPRESSLNSIELGRLGSRYGLKIGQTPLQSVVEISRP